MSEMRDEARPRSAEIRAVVEAVVSRFADRSGLGVLLVLALGIAGCVAPDAGYGDVRALTAERLNKQVRWYEHEADGPDRKRTRELLARPLSVDAAVQIALLNNQQLQSEFEELGIARSRLVSALALPNPTLDAALRFGHSSSEAPTIELDALLDLTDLIFVPFRGGAASAALDAAKTAVGGRVLDLAYETRVAFYDYQAAEQSLELRHTILEALRASFEVTQRLRDAGNITDLTYASEKATHEEARLAYSAAEANVRTRREQLNAFMGLWGVPGGQWSAEPRLADPPTTDPNLSGLEARAIERSVDLELNRRRFAAAAKRANVERARGWTPELQAGVSAEREGDAEAAWRIGPAVALEVPLFYQGQGEVGAALAEMRQEQKRFADTAVRIRAAARRAATRLAAASKSAAHYRTVLLPLRQQIVEESQLQYNAMTIGVFQLLQAKRDQIETARAYVEALRNYWVARAEVEQLQAGRLPVGPREGLPDSAEGSEPAVGTEPH
jgi:cobalt-zinc-cadmium efflux system outer membrane protein